MVSADIEPYKNDREILMLTVEQIRKDFQAFNIRLLQNDEESLSFDALYSRLCQIVDILLESQQNLFVSLLYRIDLPERKLHELFKHPGELPVVEQLTEMIIKREMLKVIYRKYWGKSQIS